jgi:hypothetical protein
MKSTTILYLIIVLCGGFLTACANLETSGTQSQELPKTGQTSAAKTTTPAEKANAATQDKDILSRDYKTAETALNKAVTEKNTAVVKLGLQSAILSIRLKTSEAIKELDDKAFVPSLTDALEENQSILDGGSETRVMQVDLNKSLVANLEKLTGMKFNLSEKPTFEEMQQVIKKSREWCAANQAKQK